MPGKVNPVICESMLQVCAQVIANDSGITIGGLGSVLELNMMLPMIANNSLNSIKILSNSINIFNKNLIKNIKPNSEKCENYIEGSLAMCTALVPLIGYDEAAQIAYEAYNTNKTIKEILQQKNLFSDEEIEKILDPHAMLKPK